ncbi:MAG: bifunctional hydroxymethylpyrimidine kinase/phosphomethylpyrimidine kinase, partial [Bacteroidales bacterium]|nr:bifunctional hydroxymethylpyrimidine kinase/phosphomethylpyrimidine kinase [Bacteroidales bacterium]
MNNKVTILTITGSDSTGGSGVQADIKSITSLGGYAASA